MKRLVEFVDSALRAVVPEGDDAARDAVIDRLSLADAAARDWLQAEELDLKLVQRLCRLARLAAQSVSRSRMLSAAGATSFEESGRIAEELIGAAENVEQSPTIGSSSALAALIARSAGAIIEKISAAGIDAASLSSELTEIVAQAKAVEAGLPRPAPMVGLAAACKKVRKLIERELDARVDSISAPDLDADLILSLSIVSGLADDEIEPVRHAYLFCVALVKGACLGGAALLQGVDDERARRLGSIAAVFDVFGLTCPPIPYSPLPSPPRVEEETEASAEVIAEAAQAPSVAFAEELPAVPLQEEPADPSPALAARPSATPVEMKFLKVVAECDETADRARRAARDVLAGRRAWHGLEAFIDDLEQFGAHAFARVGRELARLSDA